MSHCVECRYWDSETAEDNPDGRAICLKLTEATMVGPVNRLCIIRTRGDHTCEFFKGLTVDNLMGKGSA